MTLKLYPCFIFLSGLCISIITASPASLSAQPLQHSDTPVKTATPPEPSTPLVEEEHVEKDLPDCEDLNECKNPACDKDPESAEICKDRRKELFLGRWGEGYPDGGLRPSLNIEDDGTFQWEPSEPCLGDDEDAEVLIAREGRWEVSRKSLLTLKYTHERFAMKATCSCPEPDDEGFGGMEREPCELTFTKTTRRPISDTSLGHAKEPSEDCGGMGIGGCQVLEIDGVTWTDF